MEEIFSLESPKPAEKPEVTTEDNPVTEVSGSQVLVASFICVLAVFIR